MALALPSKFMFSFYWSFIVCRKIASVYFHLYFTVTTPSETTGVLGHWTLLIRKQLMPHIPYILTQTRNACFTFVSVNSKRMDAFHLNVLLQ